MPLCGWQASVANNDPVKAAALRNERRDKSRPGLAFDSPRSILLIVANKALARDVSALMASDAKSHVDDLNRRNPIHRFNRAVTGLTRNLFVNMDTVTEAHEGRQYINPVPADF